MILSDFPPRFMVSGFSAIVLLVIYLPIVIGVCVIFWRNSIASKKQKLLGLCPLNGVLWAIPLADVYYSSVQFEHA